MRAKVVDACEIAHELAPEILLDGEMPARRRHHRFRRFVESAGLPVAGKANVLIFPDIDAGNIGYKLVQRLAKAEAYGPITQGIAAP